MLIDSHYHVLMENFNAEDTVSWMDRDGIDKVALIAQTNGYSESDIHALEGKFCRAIEGKRLLLPLYEKIMANFTTKGVNVAGHTMPIYFRPDNAPVFAAAEQYPDRFFAYITLNPDLQTKEEIHAELSKYADSHVFCGVKTHSLYFQYNAKKLEPIAKQMRIYHKPILIHMGFDDKKSILKLAKKYPDVNFVLAHTAFPYFNLIWKDLAKYPNLYVDISNGTYVDSDMAREAADILGPDHLIYGSDGPYGSMKADGTYDFTDHFKFVTKKFRDKELEQIASENFLRLIQE